MEDDLVYWSINKVRALELLEKFIKSDVAWQTLCIINKDDKQIKELENGIREKDKNRTI